MIAFIYIVIRSMAVSILSTLMLAMIIHPVEAAVYIAIFFADTLFLILCDFFATIIDTIILSDGKSETRNVDIDLFGDDMDDRAK